MRIQYRSALPGGWASGDANGDGIVTATDLAILSSCFGFARSEAPAGGGGGSPASLGGTAPVALGAPQATLSQPADVRAAIQPVGKIVADELLSDAASSAPVELVGEGAETVAAQVSAMDLPTVSNELAPVEPAALAPGALLQPVAPITAAELEPTLNVLEEVEALLL